MVLESLNSLFARDLNRLIKEIALYSKESILWETEKGINNSAGNLCLHIIGNLNAFIGAPYGKTGYVRNREQEFLQKNVPRQEIIDKLTSTISIIDHSFKKITEEELKGDFPILVFKEKTSLEFFLMHLSGHLNYHLGQVNYHRRLLDK